MNEQIFPSWWGPEGGAPIQCRRAREVRDGWVRHEGHYDAQVGQWVPRAPPARSDGEKEGGSAPAGPDPRKRLRAAYKRRFGKKPFSGWDEATLRAKLERKR